MKHYHIYGRIDKENYIGLIDFLNQNEGVQKSISINSGGGEVGYAEAMLYAMNEVSNEIELVGINGIYSCAFYLFYRFKGRKVLFNGTKGMIHRVMSSVTINDNGGLAYTEDECSKADLKERQERNLEWVKSFMTAKELRTYKKGWDVYFTTSRMKEIFTDAVFEPK